MGKFKLIAYWVFLAAAITAGLVGYFHLKNNHKPSTDALLLLPDSCSIYFRSSSLHELEKSVNGRNLIADKLRAFDEIAEVFSALHVADSILWNDETLNSNFAKSVVHLAVYPGGNWMVSANIAQLGKQEDCLLAIKTALKNEIAGDLLTFTVRGKKLYAEFFEGSLLLSNSEISIRKAKGTSPKLGNNPNFKKFYATISENKLLSVYCQQSLLDNKKSLLALNLIVKSGYFAVGVDAEPSELRINGYQWVDSSSHISALSNQHSCDTKSLLSSLPYDTQWFVAYGITNLGQLPIAENAATSAFWNQVHQKALFNVNHQWKEHSGNVLARCGTYGQKQLVVCGSNDTIVTDESLNLMSDSTWQVEGKVFYRLAGKTPVKLFEPFVTAAVSYAARIGENIYYSADFNELQSTLTACAKGRFLLLNEDFLRYMQNNVPEEFNYLLYNAPSQTEHLAVDFIRANALPGIKPFENFRHLSYSLLAEKNYFKCRFHLQHESNNAEKQVLWSCKLDTVCSQTPSRFINHNTGEHEILIQDDANTLYLINAKGAIIWKKQLSEKIKSSIQLVDCYKNGKYQMLFNTAGKLHLLDRNGVYLPNFPVKLPANATAALSVFDYENTRDYRVLIPCADKTIYNYTLGGKKLEGFSPVKTDDIVQLPLQYITVGESQYLIALDVEGKIYSFSRKGVGRIGLRNRTIINCPSFFVDAGNSLTSTQLVYFDASTGHLNKINFTDTKSIVNVNGNYSNAVLTFAQIDDNRSMDVLIGSNEQVGAFDLNGYSIFEKSYPSPIQKTEYISGDSYSLLISYSSEAQKIFCSDLLHNKEININASGVALVDDLFKESKQYLIVPNGSDINCVPIR